MASKSKRDKNDAKIYKQTELVGTSRVSYTDATAKAIERASKTLRNLDWFEVSELRGAVRDGKVSQYQVKLKVGFRLD